MKSRLLLPLLLGLSACANSLTQEEVEWQRQIDRENWTMCKTAYRRNHVATISFHPHARSRKHTPHEVKEDLRANHCHLVLGDYWIEY